MEKFPSGTPRTTERGEVRRHTSETLSEGIKDTAEGLRTIAEMITDNPERLYEVIADLQMIANDLEKAGDQTETLEESAAIDRLTGLPNRRYFDESLAKNISHALRQERHGFKEPLHVLFVDLDHFKNINDTYGHDVGDLYLTTIASHMQKAFLREYDMVARKGGDEFVGMIIGCDATDAQLVAERVRNAVVEGSLEAKREYQKREGVILGANEGNVTASVGITRLRDGDTQETIEKRADRAMYQAKESGKNQVVFADEGEDSSDDKNNSYNFAVV